MSLMSTNAHLPVIYVDDIKTLVRAKTTDLYTYIAVEHSSSINISNKTWTLRILYKCQDLFK